MPSIFPTLNLVAHDDLGEANGASPIATFARASVASRVDAAGVLETAGNDLLRHDYDPISGQYLGWLIEDARTNILLHSQGFDDPYWDKVATSITPDAIVAPDESPTADKLVEDSSSGAHSVRRLNALTSGITYTGSVFAKAAERSTLQIVLGFGSVFGTTQAISVDLAAGTAALSSGSPAFGIEPFQDGWYRCWLSQAATASGSTNFTLAINNNAGYPGDGSSGLYLWGAQFEAGGHASSYIATTGSAVTREADALTIPLGAFPYSTREGTLFAAVSLDALPASSSADDRQHVAHLYGADNESRWFFREDGLAFLGRRDGGAFSSQDNRFVVPGFAPGTVYRCAVAFTRDDFVIGVDGQLSAPFAAPLGMAAASELRIGRDGTSRFLNGPPPPSRLLPPAVGGRGAAADHELNTSGVPYDRFIRGGSVSQAGTADGNPIPLASDEHCTLSLLIRWTEIPGTENILRPGSSSTGDWLWMASSDKLWGRHADIDSPASGDGRTITAGWHTLVRV